MKIAIFFLTLFFASNSSASILKCEQKNLLLIDKSECEFLGKTIGTPYQCMMRTSEGRFFYDRGKETLGVYIQDGDDNFEVKKDEEKK